MIYAEEFIRFALMQNVSNRNGYTVVISISNSVGNLPLTIIPFIRSLIKSSSMKVLRRRVQNVSIVSAVRNSKRLSTLTLAFH